jgi:hypothetical protein
MNTTKFLVCIPHVSWYPFLYRVWTEGYCAIMDCPATLSTLGSCFGTTSAALPPIPPTLRTSRMYRFFCEGETARKGHSRSSHGQGRIKYGWASPFRSACASPLDVRLLPASRPRGEHCVSVRIAQMKGTLNRG